MNVCLIAFSQGFRPQQKIVRDKAMLVFQANPVALTGLVNRKEVERS